MLLLIELSTITKAVIVCMPICVDAVGLKITTNSCATTVTSARNIIGEIQMPSKSPKQARMMAAAAHDPKFAKKVGIPQKVAKEFNKADKKKGKRR